MSSRHAPRNSYDSILFSICLLFPSPSRLVVCLTTRVNFIAVYSSPGRSHGQRREHGLVIDASSISNLAITSSILNGSPTLDTFDQVAALTNRLLTPEMAMSPTSDRLQLVSGLCLQASAGQDGIKEVIKANIIDVGTVSHADGFGRRPLLTSAEFD
ncbi:hypothetical protein P152DRAFT_81991 [Eremomyces bilateralis CBS 781.70]|uniref:PRISE-like Rossmann-fold domain-containing protein n=1 Tax=Eremomyces bilateralis CBS 781.70 TaxID=1392243 RepID=A0A6G1FYH0_9PEZI|nr:uncharacterized protein P152DRAFT_81991 [Eremomyces bilateralis CBS 781.70]KAF1810750.1 hypothetical protein P152DRAFT_81991 [Eremomyces bilateralis CBS 781.70]